MYKRQAKIQEIAETEGIINYLNQQVTEYLVKINALDLEDNDRDVVGALFHVVNDYERVGDHSENIAEQAQILIGGKADLSPLATQELQAMRKAVTEILNDAYKLFITGSGDHELAFKVNNEEEYIDTETDRLKDEHIERLNSGACSAQSGAVYNDVLINLERIADHATNIAFSLQNTKHKPIRTGVKKEPYQPEASV